MIDNDFYVMDKKIIEHRSPMQTKESQPSGQRIMPETRKLGNRVSGIIR